MDSVDCENKVSLITGEVVTVDGGGYMEYTDGNLTFFDEEDNVVAAFAAGQWTHFVNVDKESDEGDDE